VKTITQLKRRFYELDDEQFLQQGECLNGLRLRMSTPTFMEVLKRRRLGLRKAYYLIETTQKLGRYKEYWGRLSKLGWTKCQLIASQLSERDFRGLLEFAEEHSVQDLKAYGRRSTRPHRRCVLIYLTPAQYRVYERALLKCGARPRGRGLTNKEVATVRMAKIIADAG
jgi:hypothetical protein